MQKYLYGFLVLFTLFLGFYLYFSWSHLTGSQYVYSLDDVYIHLAISKNFADYGSWSIAPHHFDSASSSVLYTLVLAFLIKIFGDNIYYPLILNILFGYGTTYLIYRYFKTFYTKFEVKLALVFFLTFTILYYLVLLSMEHVIHMFLMVLFAYVMQLNIRSNFKSNDFVKLLVCLVLIGLVRFESMFLTTIVGFLFLLLKQWKHAVLALFAGFLPIVIFGLWSINSGGYFFPNSVLIKGNYPSSSLFESLWRIFSNGILFNKQFYKYLFCPILITLLYWWQVYYKKASFVQFIKSEFLAISIIVVAVLHSLFALLYYRYESYVMVSVLMVFIPVVSYFIKALQSKNGFKNAVNVLALFCIAGIVSLSIYRVWYHHPVIKYSSKNIEEQQVEMSRFMHTYYKGQKVAANDIGAIAYFGNVQLLDMVGLGSTNVAQFILEHKNLPEADYQNAVRNYLTTFTKTHHYKVAVIYPDWFPNQIPDHWIPVASWTISNRMSAAMDRVVWYAIDPLEEKKLRQHLHDFNLNSKVQFQEIKSNPK